MLILAYSGNGYISVQMASSQFETEQYTSEAFVESAGAILFRLSSQEVCVIYHKKRNEYLLAKGRRNCGETRQAAALREVTEETGFPCRLLPLNMFTRAPPEGETEQMGDQPRFYSGICEPFTLQLRRLSDSNVKLIWWFVAAIEEEQTTAERNEEDKDKFDVEFYSYTDVLEKLTFQIDRDLMRTAVDLVTKTSAD
jgi:8-oxo-dGTP pyrophosphatase MutT (NUDIX family)